MKKITLTLIATFVATILVGCGSSGKSISKSNLNTDNTTPQQILDNNNSEPSNNNASDNNNTIDNNNSSSNNNRVIDDSDPLPF
jgi:pyrroline-5-carboxylate reductase